jgi:hypothetical protein
MIVDVHGNPIEGLSDVLTIKNKTWQEQCAHEIHEAQGRSPLSESDIMGHIKRYSDGIFNHLANCPVRCEMRVRIPGTPVYQSIVGNTIKAGAHGGATTAIRQFKGPIFVEAVMFEAKKV